MLKFSGFHFKKPIVLCSAVACFALMAVDASAQTENGKIDEINPKTNDRVVLEDHTVIQDNGNFVAAPVKVTPQQKTNPVVIRREFTAGEAGTDKEVKKADSPSTLSFNIFLYIVDKFKAD